jgi:dTMP kinase
MNRKYPGYLITFEGPEGGGKSFIVRGVAEELENLGLSALTLIEPGGTEIGDIIRALLFDIRYSEIMSHKTETWLFQASRAQICHEQVWPALREGGIILLDRFTDSSVVYQGYARGLGCGKVARMNSWSTGGLVPDLTILLDLDVKLGIKRKKGQGEVNRLDNEEISFHERVRHAYRTLALTDINHSENPRWVIVNAEGPKEEVRTKVVEIVEGRLIREGLLEGNRVSAERR